MIIEYGYRKKQPIKVMIVENHQLILWGLDKLINERRPDMEVVGVACNAAEAISRAAQVAPDVVLLKYEFTRAAVRENLLQTLKNAGCRTLLLIDELTSETLQLSLRSGAHGLLTRKSRAEEVIKAIEKTHEGELWFGREATGIVLNAMREPRRQAEAGGKAVALLTPRERKVLQAVLENTARTNKDLAQRLFISESTLRNHLSSIYQKFGVTNRLDLYVQAQQSGVGADLAESAA